MKALWQSSFENRYKQRCPLCNTPILDAHYPCKRCFEGVLGYGRYEEPLSDLIITYKIAKERRLKSVLASFYLTILKTLEKPVLVPIPASNEGREDRGFDQMLLIAKVLKQKENLPFLSLLRPIGKEEQKFLTSEQRKNSTSFTLLPNKDRKVQYYIDEGYQFVLLDDISTTGTTLDTCKDLLFGTYGIQAYRMALALS